MAHHGTPKYHDGIHDMSIRQLECFVAVAEEQQFLRASRRLRMAQPPVSRLIQRMEQSLGVPLFERTSRGVVLTAVGDAMLAPARRVLSEMRRVAEAGRRAAVGDVGALSIGFSSSAAFSVLPTLIRAYRSANPAVHLTLRELTTADQIEQLETGLLDVAIARGPIARGGIVAASLHREPFVAVVPADHRLAARRRIRLGELAGDRFVFIPRYVAPAFYDGIMRACSKTGTALRIAEEAAEWHTIVGLVGANLGVSITPASLQRLAWTTVAFRPLLGPRVSAELVIAHRGEDPTPLVRGFVAVATGLGYRPESDQNPSQNAARRG